MTGKIFISYRRNDSEVVAHRMFDWLVEQFGSDAVFIDIDRIPYGADFRAHITDQVRQARVVLLIIGETWLEALNNRANDPDDWLRHELETAFAEGKDVIPVLIDRATMPGAKLLPLTLAKLAFLNAAGVSATKDFRHHMGELAERLAVGWGVERRMSAPDVVGSLPPATADLVVPSQFRGVTLPPPKVGERWEKVAWPKPVDNTRSILQRWVGEEFSPVFGTWVHDYYTGTKLALCDGFKVGFIDFARLEFNIYQPFDYSVLGRAKEKPPRGLIRNITAIDDGVAFGSGGMLCHYQAVGSGYREDLWTTQYPRSYSFRFEDEKGLHVLSRTNSSGVWMHKSEDRASVDYTTQFNFIDFYRAKKRLKRLILPTSHNYDELTWSPTGRFVLGVSGFIFLVLVVADLDNIKIHRFESSEDWVKRFPLPNGANAHSIGASWHPSRDYVALAAYRINTVNDGGTFTRVFADNWHVCIYDVGRQELRHALPVDEPRELLRLAWSQTGRHLACGGDGRCVFVFDLLTGGTQKLFGHAERITSLQFSPDGQRLLSSDGKRCLIWNPENGERVAEWDGSVDDYKPLVRESAWSPGGDMVVTSGWEVRRLVVS